MTTNSTPPDPAIGDPVAPGITPAVAGWLGQNVPGLQMPLAFSPIGTGRSNLTYLVADRAGRNVVLRRPPLGQLLPSAHDMAREHRVLEALRGTAVPVPPVLGICRDTDVAGGAFYVMERVDGVVIEDDASARELPMVARQATAGALGSALARLHAVDIDRVGLGDLARRSGYAERQLRRWGSQWEMSRTRPLPVLEQVQRQLHAQIPTQQAAVLVHGDYNLANVILDPRTGGVRAIVDWELCTIGDPIADLGTLMAYWPDEPSQSMIERDPVQLLPGYGDRADVVAAYAAQAPERDRSSLPFWTALAYWKLAVILQGVYARWLQNPANGGRDPDRLGVAIDRMAELAAQELG